MESNITSLVRRMWMILKSGWMKFAFGVAWLNTRILLTLIYFLVLGPMAIGIWVMRKDFLRKRIKRNGSYWIKKESIEHTVDRQGRQF